MVTIRYILAVTLMISGCASDPRVHLADDDSFLNGRGERVKPLESATKAALVLIFITADCPISNGYAPEINSIVRDYEPRGAKFDLVHVERNLSAQQAQQHAEEFGYTAQVLLDPQQRLVRAIGATVTPEAAVIDPSGRLVYRGRIDDRYTDLGKRRFEPSKRDLRDVLDEVLSGRPMSPRRTKAVGCFIPEIGR